MALKNKNKSSFKEDVSSIIKNGFFKVLAQEVNGGILIFHGLSGKCCYANKRALDIVGYSEKEIIGSSFIKLLSKSSINKFKKIYSSRIKKGSFSKSSRVKIIRADDKIITIEAEGKRIKYHNRIFIAAIFRDVSVKEAEEMALKEKEDLYLSLLERAIEPLYAAEPKTGRILVANDAFLRLVGYSRSELKKITCYHIIQHKRENIDKNVENIIRTGKEVDGDRLWRRKDGKIIHVYTKASRFIYNKQMAVLVCGQDITRIKEEEQLRLKIDNRYKLISEISSDFAFSQIISKKKRWTVEWETGAFKRMFGFSCRDLLVKKKLSKFFPESAYPLFKQRKRDILAGKTNEIEFFMKNSRGKTIWLNFTTRPIFDETGKVIKTITAGRNVTNEKLAEGAIKNNLAKMEARKLEWISTVDSLDQVIFVVDKNWRIIRANKTMEKWGMGLISGAKGKNIYSLIHKRCREKNCALKKFFSSSLIAAAHNQKSEWEGYDKYFKKFIRIQVNPVIQETKLDNLNSYNGHAVVIIHDITREKEIEQKIIDLYKHLGVINRRVAVLLDMEKTGSQDNKKKIFDFILESALKLSNADACFLYGYSNKAKTANFVQAMGNLSDWSPKYLPSFTLKESRFLRQMVRDKRRIQGKRDEFVFKYADPAGIIKHFVALPLLDSGKLFGFIFVSFSDKNYSLSTQELDFYEVFASHASMLLRGIL